jgi:hypothetical protein
VQPLVTPIRAHLTEAQVVSLIQDTPAITLGAGMELVTLDLAVIEDISADLAGGTVRRNSYADLHASGTFRITRDLDWGAALIRPYVTVSDGSITARFNLGVYHTNTPKNDASESPPTFDVEGYDLLLRLSKAAGEAYAINAGDVYLDRILEILADLGYTRILVDQSAAATVAPTSRVWAFADNYTWLTIVNDMLASIGYAGIWSDWDGYLRLDASVLPQHRSIEWTYTDDPDTTMLAPRRDVEFDFFDAPNKWVFFRSNDVESSAPVEGNGIYTYLNQSVGPTSVDARGGLVVPRVEGVDAADHAALVVQAQAAIQADMDVPTLVNVDVAPNPLHWHFDRLYVQDAGGLPGAHVQCTEWSFTLLEAADMPQSWRVISL